MEEGFSLNWGGDFPISYSYKPLLLVKLLNIRFLSWFANRSAVETILPYFSAR